jgi:hypothetical protein
MQRPRLLLIAGALLITSSAAAQDLFPPKRDPYRGLFAPRMQQPERRPAPQAVPRAAPQKPKVVCGMVIVPADPTVDPRIRAQLPDTGVDYRIRTVRPSICKPE